jgi:hypothetical protein
LKNKSVYLSGRGEGKEEEEERQIPVEFNTRFQQELFPLYFLTKFRKNLEPLSKQSQCTATIPNPIYLQWIPILWCPYPPR